MKNQKSKIKIKIILLLFCASIILGACGTKWTQKDISQAAKHTKTMENSTTSPTTPTIIPTIAPTIAPSITPIITPSNTSSSESTVVDEVSKDIDGNGIMDSLKIIGYNDGSETVMRVFLNKKQIFEYQDSFCRMMGVDSFECLDLDGDQTNEIFITASTDANSRPYEEVLCLKQTDGKWKQMEYPKNENGYYEFPFDIMRGKNEFDFVITSKLTKQVIHYDATQYFSDENSDNINSIKSYRSNHYKQGDKVGFISAWGIHDAKIGTFNGKKCIIALQRMEGPYGNGIGEINIYFNYNKQGQVNILKVKYFP